MRKLAFFLVVYHDIEVDKMDYCYILASDEEHAIHDFIRNYHGRRLILEIIRQHENEKIY